MATTSKDKSVFSFIQTDSTLMVRGGGAVSNHRVQWNHAGRVPAPARLLAVVVSECARFLSAW